MRSRILLGAFLIFLTGVVGWAAEPKEPSAYLDSKEFFEPELYLSSSHVPLDEILPNLPNRAAWQTFLAAKQLEPGETVQVFGAPLPGRPATGCSALRATPAATSARR